MHKCYRMNSLGAFRVGVTEGVTYEVRVQYIMEPRVTHTDCSIRLPGNRFFEYPSTTDDPRRTKRMVKYTKKGGDMWEYASSGTRLPG